MVQLIAEAMTVHDTTTRYYLAGVRVPRRLYRACGRCVPYRLRDVRTR